MTEILNKAAMFTAVTEIIEVFGGLKDDDNEDLVITKKTPDTELKQILEKVVNEKLIQEGDEFTPETQAVLDAVTESLEPVKPAKKEVKKPVAEKPVKKAEMKVVKAAENPNQDLIDEINEIETVGGLKGIVKTDAVFKPLLPKIASYKEFEPLKEAMLALLNPITDVEPTVEDVPEDEPEVVKPVKKAEKVVKEKVVAEKPVKKEKKEKGGKTESATYIVRRAVCENFEISNEKLAKILKEKGTTMADVSITMRKNEMLAAISILKELGKLD